MGDYSKHHFSDEQWSDYVRNVMPEAGVAEIKRHLDEGCAECRQAAQFWSEFCKVGAQAFSLEPPPDAIRAAEALFEKRSFAAPRRKSTRLAELIFDSLLQPAPAGVRGNRHSPRRVTRRAGRWVIDLQIEQASGSRMLVTGQVINSSRSARTGRPLSIALRRGETVLDTSSTNQFGEFQISAESGAGLNISIDVPGRNVIEVPLPGEDQPDDAR